MIAYLILRNRKAMFRYDWERTYSRDELLDGIPTSGGLTSLAPDQVAEVLAAVGAVVDELGGIVTLPHATWGLTAIRTDAPPPPTGE
jgi:hypothetical protein